MPRFTLYTYRDIKELRKIQTENEVFSFIYVETLKLLEENPDIFLDISTLIHFLNVNKSDRLAAINNLKEMTDETTVIVEESLADEAITIFPFLFSSFEPFFELVNESDAEKSDIDTRYIRQPIYTYNNADDLQAVIEYANLKHIPIATFTRASEDDRDEFEKFNKSVELALMDLTSVSYVIDNNKSLIYSVEHFLNQIQNIKIIAQTSRIDKLLQYFPLYTEGQKSITNLLPELENHLSTDIQSDEVKKITSLSEPEFACFMDYFNHNLIGHNYFKERLKKYLEYFIALNKAKEQKVLSVFLFGKSGIGKTEVARLIADGLQENSYLAKINFQNYSSQDALNSLIGSPAGYIGCEHGELSDKVGKSKVGMVLCDEFEKTTRPVFSFFLELLEEGRFTDSMAREYDLDGYIIIFTSNLQNEVEYKKVIPPELQTRFDLVCEFQEPTNEEKVAFLDLLLDKAKTKYVDQFSKIPMTSEEKIELYNFDFSSLSALRDIKRVFNHRLMDYFYSKGVWNKENIISQ
jgi:hypothetical protein